MSYKDLSPEELIDLLEERDKTIQAQSEKIKGGKDSYKDDIIWEYEKAKTREQAEAKLSEDGYNDEAKVQVLKYMDEKGLTFEEALKLADVSAPEGGDDAPGTSGYDKASSKGGLLDIESFSKLSGDKQQTYIEKHGHEFTE